MKFRRRGEPHVLGFQIAPMVDVLLVLLCFFILTWSFARKEMELSVKVPSAENGGEPNMEVNQTVVNIREDGSIVMNTKSKPLSPIRRPVIEMTNLIRLAPAAAIR